MKTKGYEIPTCQKCEAEYSLRDGCDPSDYCDECAQGIVVGLREAMEDIAEPMRKIQDEAKAQGARIDGMAANALCQDANWLRDKARLALREHCPKGERK